MKTNNVQELIDLGFTVTKTKDVNTVIEHSNPFKLNRSGKDDYAAPLNEDTGTYAVTIGGYPSNGNIEYDVVQYTTPLLREINESAKITVAVDENISDNEITNKLQKAIFEEITVKSEFFKTDDASGVKYVKVSESAYIKSGNTIGSAIELVANASDEMYVTEMHDDGPSGLNKEQKRDIVDHAPEGLSPDDFAEYVGHDLENIPGLETLDPTMIDSLIQELSHLYFGK